MSILLTDEEMGEIIKDWQNWLDSDPPYPNIEAMVTRTEYVLLRKVVEWLERGTIRVDTIRTDQVVIWLPLQDWQQLRREAGLD